MPNSLFPPFLSAPPPSPYPQLGANLVGILGNVLQGRQQEQQSTSDMLSKLYLQKLLSQEITPYQREELNIKKQELGLKVGASQEPDKVTARLQDTRRSLLKTIDEMQTSLNKVPAGSSEIPLGLGRLPGFMAGYSAEHTQSGPYAAALKDYQAPIPLVAGSLAKATAGRMSPVEYTGILKDMIPSPSDTTEVRKTRFDAMRNFLNNEIDASSRKLTGNLKQSQSPQSSVISGESSAAPGLNYTWKRVSNGK